MNDFRTRRDTEGVLRRLEERRHMAKLGLDMLLRELGQAVLDNDEAKVEFFRFDAARAQARLDEIGKAIDIVKEIA